MTHFSIFTLLWLSRTKPEIPLWNACIWHFSLPSRKQALSKRKEWRLVLGWAVPEAEWQEKRNPWRIEHRGICDQGRESEWGWQRKKNDFKYFRLSGQGKIIIWILQRTQKDPPYPKIVLLAAFTRNLHSARNCAKSIMVYLILTQILVMKYFSFPREGNDLGLEGTRSEMTPEHPRGKWRQQLCLVCHQDEHCKAAPRSPPKDLNPGEASWPRGPRTETESFQHHGDILHVSAYHERVLVKRKHQSTTSFWSELLLSQTHLSLLNSVCFELKKVILKCLLSWLTSLCPSLRIFLQWKRKQLSEQIHIGPKQWIF